MRLTTYTTNHKVTIVEQCNFSAATIYRSKSKHKLLHYCFLDKHGNKRRASKHEAKTQFWPMTGFNSLLAKQVRKDWKATTTKNLQALSLKWAMLWTLSLKAIEKVKKLRILLIVRSFFIIARGSLSRWKVVTYEWR